MTTFAAGQIVTIIADSPSYPLARGKRGQVNSITTDPVSGDTVYSVLTTERVGVQPRTRPGGPGGDLYEVHGLRAADLVEVAAPDPIDQALAYRPPGCLPPEAGTIRVSRVPGLDPGRDMTHYQRRGDIEYPIEWANTHEGRVAANRWASDLTARARVATYVYHRDVDGGAHLLVSCLPGGPSDVSDGDGPDLGAALAWAETAVAGEYLVEYEDTGLTEAEDPGSRCGYDDAELAQIQRALAARDLRLAADDRGLVAQSVRS